MKINILFLCLTLYLLTSCINSFDTKDVQTVYPKLITVNDSRMPVGTRVFVFNDDIRGNTCYVYFNTISCVNNQ